jgi:hypothetical protein
MHKHLPHQAMIGTIFALTGQAIFMLAVAVMDAARSFIRECEEIEAAFGHDALIFPDYTNQ